MATTRPIVSIDNPKSAAAEAYRSLRTNIQFCGVEKEIRTIAVTSSGPGEGKSTTAVNLAVSMANSGQRVILIDADLRRPVLHKVFDLSNNSGLTNLLVGGKASAKEASQEIGINGLQIITSGPIPPNPAELLGSHSFKDLLDELAGYVDVIIIDTPPIVAVTDAALIGSRVDGVILVVSSRVATRQAAIQAKTVLENVKANILGVVLNKLDSRTGDYYYYYYYGQGRKKKA